MLPRHGARHASRRACSSSAGKSSDQELVSRLKNILSGNAGPKRDGEPLLSRLKRILVARDEDVQERSKADDLSSTGGGHEAGLAPHASMIEAFCKTGMFEQAYKGAMAMLSQGLTLEGSLLKTLLYGLYKCGHWNESKSLAREMIVRDQSIVVKETFQGLLQQDGLFYSTLVEGLCRAGKVDEAYAVFTGAAAKTRYTSSSCTALIQALDALGTRTEQVFHVAVFMMSKGMPVRSGIFNRYIRRLCDAVHHDLLVKACFRDNFTTLDHKGVLLELCDHGKVDEASQFLLDMAESDPQTFVETLPRVCEAIVAKGEPELLLRFTRSSRLQHTAATYNVVIHALCRGNNAAEARRMLLEMRRLEGFEPDESTLALLNAASVDAAEAIRKLVAEGKEAQALEFYNRVSPGTLLNLDIASYNALLRELWLLGRETEALKLFQQIARSGLVPDATTCNILVDGLCSVNKAGAAFKILHSMRGLGCVPEQQTYTKLLKAACEGDELHLVELVVDEMHENGLRPDYHTALVSYSKREMLAEMQELFKEMISRGCEPSNKSYQLVIGRLCEANMLDAAWDVIHHLEKSEFRLHHAAYLPYIVGLLKAGEVELARKRSRSMDSAFLFHCFVEAGLHTEAYGLYNKMLREEGCDSVQVLAEVISNSSSGTAVASKLLSSDSSGISKVVQRLVTCRRLDAVVELLAQWCETNDKISRDRTCDGYDKVIMDMCKDQRFEEAAHVLESLSTKGVLARLLA